MENLYAYYGVDWLASSLSVLMIFFLGNKNKVGFLFGLSANLSWLLFAWLAASPAIFLSNTIFFVLHVRGAVRWKKTAAQDRAVFEGQS